MRVALVHVHVLEDLAGIGVKAESYDSYAGYEHRYARLLRSHGLDADLIVFSRGVDVVRRLKHAWGHDVVLLPIKGMRFLRQVNVFRELLRLVKEYDVVHCFSYYSNFYDVLAFCCQVAGVPLVAQSQGIWPSIPLMPRLRKMLTLRLASRLVPLNMSEARFLKDRFNIGGDRVVVVPNFIVPEDHVPLMRGQARRMIGVDDDAFVVLTVCRLVPGKGVQTLLEAVASIRDKVHGLVAMVVGEGPFRNSLERMAAELNIVDFVRFVGYVPNQELNKFFSAADCFVFASLEESFGIVLLEAMLYGLPVVSTRTWGPSEIVVDGETGLLYKPGDSAGLADAIAQIYRNPDRSRVMGEAGRKRVLENYTAENVYRLLRRVYAGLGS
ncbi:MAG: glycosyltransferase family 4 protein [Candidatus Caldarchaeum sp.]